MRTLLSRIAGFIRRARLDRRLHDEVAGILIGVAMLASLLPALRAIRLNPVAALRQN